MAEQPTPSPSPAASAQEKKKAASEKKAGAEEELDIPVPEGVPVKGIKVPHYDENGNLQVMLDAEVARKIDADHIEMENLKVDAYGDDGKKFYVELPRSVFNLQTRILNGESRVLIRREDFQITGDAGEFHLKNRYAKILGNVKMIIFSTENFATP